MDKMNSYNDLKIPDGLFPEIETHLLDRLGLKVIWASGKPSIEKINEYLLTADELYDRFEEVSKVPEVRQHLPSILEVFRKQRKISWDEMPEANSTKKEFLIVATIAKSIIGGNGDVENAFNNLEIIREKFESVDHFVSVAALIAYLLGIKAASDIKPGAYDHESKIYRLGKTGKYFFFARMLLEFKGVTFAELNALSVSETQSRRERVRKSSKAGSKSYADQKAIQRCLIEKFLSAKMNEPKLVKAQFVTNFISDLSDNERKPCSASNLNANFLNVIRKYENGTISKEIWPGPA